MTDKKIQVAVATHKFYKMPKDPMYLPLLVGHFHHPDVAVPEGWRVDDQPREMTISPKNPYYCELTALYWMWKNSQADAKGLVHYRRQLSLSRQKSFSTVLTAAQADQLLTEYDFILPEKRRYYIETIESHYLYSHHYEPLQILKQVIREQFPEYNESLTKILSRRSAHMFNMLIANSKPFNEYCAWLFSVLHEVGKKVDLHDYDDYEARVFGFLSEFLLDVWLDQHRQYSYTTVHCVFMEKQNWLKKGGKFLKRKFISDY